ncbi:MAG: hypothetical protein F4Y69_00495 [Chloroflexi bacterium]|nr:hypothetical protein [Chloroflexota bacterium]MYF21798.1 hypothetical protein [Chloroflexota bacterium]
MTWIQRYPLPPRERGEKKSTRTPYALQSAYAERMNATVVDHVGGLAWSEDPRGIELNALRIDFEGASPHSVSLPRRGPIRLTEFAEADALSTVRDDLLEAERSLGGPSVLRWRADGLGGAVTNEARLIDEPLPWGGGPGRGLPQTPNRLDRWSRANAGEIMPNVMTPLSWSVIADPLDRGFHVPWGDWTEGRRFVAMYDGYVYFNIGLMLELIQQRFGLTGAHFLEAVGGPEAAAVEQNGDSNRATRIRWTKLVRQVPYLLRWLRDQDTLPKRWPQERAIAEAERDRLKALDLSELSDRDILRELTRSSAESERQVIFLMRAQSAVYAAAQGLLWAIDRWLGIEKRNLVLSVLQGVPGIRTQDGNLALRRIAERASRESDAVDFVRTRRAEEIWPSLHGADLPASLVWLRQDLDEFIDEYGHRAAGELEIAEPRWAEQPELILDTFREYVLNPEQGTADETVARQRQVRIDAEQQIKDELFRHPFGYLRWPLFRAQIHQARRLQPLRENPKFTLLELSQQQRTLWKTLTARWIDAGLLSQDDDIYYLLFEEMATLARRSEDPDVGARMRSRIRRRRAQFAEWRQTPAPPLRDPRGEVIGLRSVSVDAVVHEGEATDSNDAAESDGPSALRGIAASAGVAEGVAHVADSPAVGREIQSGQILVARFTDPGWTPIFPLAAAVVTEIGGVLSHGAIVAREFGIPAVVNVQKATEIIRSGDTLRVDGSNGEVTILDRA